MNYVDDIVCGSVQYHQTSKNSDLKLPKPNVSWEEGDPIGNQKGGTTLSMRNGVITLIHTLELNIAMEEEEGQSLIGMGYKSDIP